MKAKQKAWRVYLGARHIETVYFDSDMLADEIRRSLVNHDGFNPAITVKSE